LPDPFSAFPTRVVPPEVARPAENVGRAAPYAHIRPGYPHVGDTDSVGSDGAVWGSRSPGSGTTRPAEAPLWRLGPCITAYYMPSAHRRRVLRSNAGTRIVDGWRPARDSGTLQGMATHWTLGCDAADPNMLAAFWAIALGYVTEPGYEDPDGASIIDPDGVGPAIGFLRVPEGKTAKNRVHIDIRVAGDAPSDMVERERLIRAKSAELVAAGATRVREEYYGEHFGHIVMLDPEGNEFCVA
jgi:hypothetical protein